MTSLEKLIEAMKDFRDANIRSLSEDALLEGIQRLIDKAEAIL